jgi:hypothetical protein
MAEEVRRIAVDLTAGTVGGCSGIVVGYPLDTVRVRLMSTVTNARYRGMLHCFMDIVRSEGVRGRWLEKAWGAMCARRKFRRAAARRCLRCSAGWHPRCWETRR